MALPPGTCLGVYEITAQIGAGGMGEVYKGRDTRLDRAVAIKILSNNLAADPQFRGRFDREARRTIYSTSRSPRRTRRTRLTTPLPPMANGSSSTPWSI